MRKPAHLSRAYRRKRPRNLHEKLYLIINDYPVCFVELEHFRKGITKLPITEGMLAIQEYCFGAQLKDKEGIPNYGTPTISHKDETTLGESFEFYTTEMIKTFRKLIKFPPATQEEVDVLFGQATDFREKAAEVRRKISMISKLSE